MSDQVEHELNDGPTGELDGGIGAGGALEDSPPQAAPAAEDPAPAPPAESRTETRNGQPRPGLELVDQAAELELRGRLTELEHKHNQAVDALSARAGFALVVAFGAVLLALGVLTVLRNIEGVE